MPDNHLLRIIHEQVHAREQYIHQLLVILQHGVAVDYILKNKLDDLVFQAGRDVLDEECHFLLILLALLRVLKEADDARLQVRRQANILHGCVDTIQLFLESICFLIEVLYQHGHVSKNVRIDNGADRVGKHNEEGLDVASREAVVAGEKQNRRVY